MIKTIILVALFAALAVIFLMGKGDYHCFHYLC